MSHRERVVAHANSAGKSQNEKTLKKHVEDVICRITSEQSGQSSVMPNEDFNQLNLDSLDKVEIVMAVEDEFAIALDDEELEGIDNAGEFADYLLKA